MAIIWVGTGRFNAYSGPVQDYIDRVVAADVAAGNTLGLEVGVRDSYDVFINDSINVGDLGASGGVLSQANSIIKAAPIMAGARTLAGALVPMVGPEPTNVGFLAPDYSRKTGLLGDGVGKYLASNYTYPLSLQDNCHAAIWESGSSATGSYLGAVDDINSGSFINAANKVNRHYSSSAFTFSPSSFATTGFQGITRSSGLSYQYRSAVGGTQTATISSAALTLPSFSVFRRNKPTTPDNYSSARLSFYSIGGSLNLALLNARLATLMAAIDSAIS